MAIEIITLKDVRKGDTLVIEGMNPGQILILSVKKYERETGLLLFNETSLDYAPDENYQIVRIGKGKDLPPYLDVLSNRVTVSTML